MFLYFEREGDIEKTRGRGIEFSKKQWHLKGLFGAGMVLHPVTQHCDVKQYIFIFVMRVCVQRERSVIAGLEYRRSAVETDQYMFVHSSPSLPWTHTCIAHANYWYLQPYLAENIFKWLLVYW
jgi:hypothetical protein